MEEGGEDEPRTNVPGGREEVGEAKQEAWATEGGRAAVGVAGWTDGEVASMSLAAIIEGDVDDGEDWGG